MSSEKGRVASCIVKQLGKVEMNLWNEIYLIVLCLLTYACRTPNSNGGKKMLSKFYCEKKRGWRAVQYNSFLWAVERGSSPPVYIFGTVHAPYPLVWRYLPTNVKDAFRSASHVFTEVDLRDPRVIQEIHKCRQLPGQLTLQDVLPRALFQRLKKNVEAFQKNKQRWMKAINLYSSYIGKDFFSSSLDSLYEEYSKLQPIWLTTVILGHWNRYSVKLQFQPVSQTQALDAFLVSQATEAGTYHGGIEDVSMHCQPLNSLDMNKAILALNITLQAFEMKQRGLWQEKEYDIRRVVNLYKCGDPQNSGELSTLFSRLVDGEKKKQLEEIDAHMTQELLVKRNAKMADTIDRMLRNDSLHDARFFFAVGAAHLLGNNSLIEYLQTKGYKMRHIPYEEDIPVTLERKRLEQETLLWFQTAYNHSRWQPDMRPAVPIQPEIHIHNTVNEQKTYVYYYNSGSCHGNAVFPVVFLSLVMVLTQCLVT